MLNKNIVIIGKNSKLFKNILQDGCSFPNSVALLSNKDDFDVCRDAIVILISVSKSSDSDNIRILESIRQMNPAKLILISSMSVHVAKRHIYLYPKLKYSQEKYVVTKFRSFSIIRLGSVVYSQNNIRLPDLICERQNVIDAIEYTLNDSSNSIYESYTLQTTDFLLIQLYGRLLMLLTIFSVLLRPLDYLFSKMSRCTYGYSLLSYMYVKSNVK